MRYMLFLLVLATIPAEPLRAQQSPGRIAHVQELVRSSSAASFGRTLTSAHTLIAWTLTDPPARDALNALKVLEENSFPLDTTAERIRLACDLRYNGSQFEQIIAWFQSTLGRKVAEAERAAALLDDTRRGGIRQDIRSQWVSDRRMLLLRRLDDNLGMGSRQGIYALMLLEDIIASVNRENPPQGKWSEDRVEGKLQEATDRLESRLRDSVLLEMRVTYRALSNNDLQSYNEFLESSGGRWYAELLQQGIEDAFLEGREHFLEGITQIPLRLRRMLVP